MDSKVHFSEDKIALDMDKYPSKSKTTDIDTSHTNGEDQSSRSGLNINTQ